LALLTWPLAAHASTLNVTSVTGVWTATTGTPFNLNGLGSNSIRWGDPATNAGQSGYDFVGVAPPTQTFTSSPFTLGTFTHINEPIASGTSITGATLLVTFQFNTDADGNIAHTLVETYQFAHNETPNNCGCSPGDDDIVTALLNVGGSQTIPIGGQNFVFNVTAFEQNGNTVTQFSSPEGGTNSAFLIGSFVDVRTVPGPIAGAGLPGLIAACGSLLALARRRRRQLVA
jgi:hypothetical protein